MINRQMSVVELLQCAEGYDEYGTKSANEYSRLRDIKAAVVLYEQKNTNDARFKEATHIAYTRDKEISDDMRIKADNALYDVMLVNPYGRMTVVYLREVV